MLSPGLHHFPMDYARLEPDGTGGSGNAHEDNSHDHPQQHSGDREEYEDEVEILFDSPSSRATPMDDQGRASPFLPSSSSAGSSFNTSTTTPSSASSISPRSPAAAALSSVTSLLRPLGIPSWLSSSTSQSRCQSGVSPFASLRRMRTSSSQEHAQAQQVTPSSLSSSLSSTSTPQALHPAASASNVLVNPRFHSHAPLWVQVTYFCVLGSLFLATVIDSFTSKRVYRLLEHLFAWIERHMILGPVVFWSAVVVFSILCIPESALTIGGGYIFAQAHGVAVGIVLCTTLILTGGVVGGVVSFLIARYLAFDTVQGWGRRYRLLRALDLSLVENGAKMVFLLRLSPFLPTPPLSYLLGTTSVKLSDFILGSGGMLPWVVTCSYLGSALKGVNDLGGGRGRGRAWKYVWYGLGAVATIGIVAGIGVYTRRAMEEVLREQSGEGRREDEGRGEEMETVVVSRGGGGELGVEEQEEVLVVGIATGGGDGGGGGGGGNKEDEAGGGGEGGGGRDEAKGMGEEGREERVEGASPTPSAGRQRRQAAVV